MKIKKIIKILKYATVLFVTPVAFSQQAVMDQDGIYLVCEKMPEIKGGLKALSKIIKYPKEARKLGVVQLFTVCGNRFMQQIHKKLDWYMQPAAYEAFKYL